MKLDLRTSVLGVLASCFALALLPACGGGSSGPVIAPEVLLGEWEGSSSGGSSTITNYVDFRLAGGLNGDSHNTPVASFVEPSAVGLTFRTDPVYPTYDDLLAAFTDGVAGLLRLRIAPGGTGGSTTSIGESTFFATGKIQDLSPDAAGYRITRIELEITSLALVSPGANPNNDGVWTDYMYDITLRMFGRRKL